ncbi:MAG TPA: ATP cone domain-containing protein, partial [Enterococcus sp.]|nr:ATP cone domain-containing protein [Enterococcus sp.]
MTATKLKDEQCFSPATTVEIQVIKRDGRTVTFDDQKIYNALVKAKQQVQGTLSPMDHQQIHYLVSKINHEIEARFQKTVKIYEIQNIVEHILLQQHDYALAEEYIRYRTQRDFERSQATDINFTIEKLMNKEQSIVNENA